ncbi:MAG: DUF72 domain-containing protein [Lentisphaerota bacterium]
MESLISFGIAGWSYPDWDGFVYPKGLKDKLGFIAPFVDMIEINSSFYRPPTARMTATWLKTVEKNPGFFFSAKIHQDVTHRFIIDPVMVGGFHEGLRPLRDAGRLRHLLAQFKFDFEDTQEHRDHLEKVRDAFSGPHGLVMELRHISWQAPSALAFLDGLGVIVANLDYPMAQNSFNLPVCLVGEDAYFRLHGRNRSAWFDKSAGRDATYNYYYSKPELAGLRDRAVALSKAKRSLTVVANNHYGGKEVANILQLKALIMALPLKVPDLLMSRYPDLKEIALPPENPAQQQGELAFSP